MEDIAAENASQASSVCESSLTDFLTTNKAAYPLSGRYGADLKLTSFRNDIVLKYGKYGKHHRLGDANENSCFGQSTKKELIQARLRRLQSEQATNRFDTVQKQHDRAIEEMPENARLKAKQTICSPKSDGGQEYVTYNAIPTSFTGTMGVCLSVASMWDTGCTTLRITHTLFFQLKQSVFVCMYVWYWARIACMFSRNMMTREVANFLWQFFTLGTRWVQGADWTKAGRSICKGNGQRLLAHRSSKVLMADSLFCWRKGGLFDSGTSVY